MIISYIILLIAIMLEPILETTYLSFFLIMVQVAYILFVSFFNKKKLSIIYIYSLYYLVFILGITLISNPNSYIGYALRIMTYFLQLIIGAQFFSIVMEDNENKRKLKSFFVLLMVIMSTYVIYEGMTMSNPIFIDLFREQWKAKIIYGYARGYRSAGSMESPLVMSFPIVIAFLFSYFDFRIYKKVNNIIPLFILFISIYFFNARTVYIMIFVIIVCVELFIMRQKNSKGNMTKIYLATIALLALIIKYWTSIVDIFSSDTMSYVHRFESVKFSFYEFLNQNLLHIIFGKGFGSLSYKVFVEQITITDAGFYALDNELLTFLYEFGIIGIGLLIYVLVSFYGKLNKNEQSKKYFHITFYIILFLYMMSFNVFHWYSLCVIISFLFGYLASESKVIKLEEL